MLLAAGLGAGCASRRELIVTSTPPGAIVRVGDEIVGATPLRHRFLHYGEVRVTLYEESHLTYSKVLELEPPWYGRALIDVVSDLFPWRDQHLLHVRLQPLTHAVVAGEVESILERADALRSAGPEGPDALPERRSVPLPADASPTVPPAEPAPEETPGESPASTEDPPTANRP